MATHEQQSLDPEQARRKADEAGQSGASFASKVDPQAVSAVPLIIGGEEVETGESFAVYDPARPDEAVGHAASASEDDSLRAVEAAHKAWPEWSRMRPEERAEALVAALEALDQGKDERIRTLVRENGKVLPEATIELAVFDSRCRLAAELAPQLNEVRRFAPESTRPKPVLGSDGIERARNAIAFRSEVSLMPIGVVTIIVPYNWPLAILAASLPYALIAGNTVIVKPPPTAPLALTESLRLLARGLPPGVLNVVSGSNDAVKPLIVDPRVSKLVFTGSTGAGKRMMEMCSGNLARLTLELGGNDPALVLDDAELDEAAINRLAVAAFLTTGQVCMGLKRLYVHRSRYNEVVDGLSAILDNYRIGHGLDADTSMGPLHTERQRDYVAGLRREAKQAGAEVREFGTLSDEAERQGWFLKPALVLDPSPELGIVDQEQFGPLLPILPFDELDPLIDRINGHWSGLCSSLWTSDLDRAAEVAGRLRTGTTWINNANAVAEDDRTPFGGFRQSGVGRELGVEGLHTFLESHVVTYPA